MTSALLLLGYDPALLARLPTADAHRLERVAQAWLASTAFLGAALGYGVWLISHSYAAASLGAVATGLLVLNLLRLSAAGGGVAPRSAAEDLADYEPALGPLVFLAFLALLLAQPAQLPLHNRLLDPHVAEHRQELLSAHEESRQKLGLPASRSYEVELARSEFVMYRLGLLWREPERPVRYSFSFVLLVLFPAVLARFYAQDAVRAYERERHRSMRRVIHADFRSTAAQVQALLSSWPSFAPTGAGRSAFDSTPQSPLNQPRPSRAGRRSWLKLWRRS